jgi:small GTP-binding protein
VTEFDDLKGPRPIACFPSTIDPNEQKELALAAFDFVFHLDKLPENIALLSFPGRDKKAYIKALQWEDQSVRGQHKQAAILLVFEEKDDMIFYKYEKDIAIPVEDYCQTLMSQLLRTINFSQDLHIDLLHSSLSQKLNQLEFLEHSGTSAEEFPSIEDDEIANKYVFKIIIVGDPNSGKSSTVLRYVDHAFKHSYIPTIGVNVSVKTLKIGNDQVELSLWDLAGQAKYSTFRQQFYQNAQGAVFVYDRTNPASFESIPKWFSDIKKNHPDFSKLRHCICGNKSDLVDRIQISNTQGQNLANSLNSRYLETSAKDNININEIFVKMSQELIENITQKK